MSITSIPLNRLVSSEHNVRRTGTRDDIEALAASIAAHGLLQNLTVSAVDDTRFAVEAGARRHAALKLLVRRGDITRDFAVPCHVIERRDAAEASLAENVQRVAMNVMDEVDAFAALADGGQSPDDIARRFGCGARHVEQRLALARLSPKLKFAYRKGDLSLDAARAFCLADDHAVQERVFRALGKPVTHAPSVRAQLMAGRMRATDRIACFVGLDTYEQAGGRITRDLFDPRETYVDDADLMHRLASERLEGERAALIAQGWGWVNAHIGHGRFEGVSHERIQPTRRAFTDDERAALDAIEAELDALDEALEDAEEDDARWDRRNDLESRKHAVIEPTITWDPALMAHAGVVLSIDHDGQVTQSAGLIAKADRARVAKLLRERAPSAPAFSNADGEGHEEDGSLHSVDDACAPSPSALPKAIVRELSIARARALRVRLSTSPKAALAVAVFALVERGLAHGTACGVAIDLRPAPIEDVPELAATRETILQALPDDETAALDWLLNQPVERLLDLLAVATAGALDLAHDGASHADATRQARADRLARTLDLDMRAVWSVEPAFLARLPKPVLVDLARETIDAMPMSPTTRESELKARTKLTRAELAAWLAAPLAKAGWLPDVLEGRVREPSVEQTEAEIAAIAAQ